MHLILKCAIDYEIAYVNNLQYLSAHVEDVIICDCIISIEGVQHGFGLNYRTNEYGLFPIDKFIIFDSTNIVCLEMTEIVKKSQANSNLTSGVNTPGIYHRTSKKSIGLSAICAICGEYMIGLRLEYTHCILCNQVFHGLCWKNHISLKKCHRFLKITNSRVTSLFKKNELNISEWSKEQVMQWLCSVNFFRLLDLFDKKDINGVVILGLMSDTEDAIMNDENNTLYLWSLITDRFYREALYIGLLDLLGRSKNPSKLVETNSNFDTVMGHGTIINSTNSKYILEMGGHHLREVTYLSKTSCYYCYGALLGIHKQGLHCIKCRLDFHKICAAQINVSQCTGTKMDEEVDNLNSSVFGIPLEDQVQATGEVPLFLKCCISRLESQQGISGSLLDWYSQTADTDDLIILRKKFSHPVYTKERELIGLMDIEDSLVAKLVKLFLKELPEPLLTYGLYHSFVEGLKEDRDDRSNCSHLFSLLEHLPSVHRSTLKLLIEHFECVSQRSVYQHNKVKQIAKNWSYIFSKTLIWPPHIMMNELLRLRTKHQKIIQLIFEYKIITFEKFTWPLLSQDEYVDNLVSDEEKPVHQSTSSENVMLRQDAVNVNKDIQLQDWYWSDTTKEEVIDFMSGLPDGSFLVRDSSNKSLGEYTLTVRKDGENKLIRILYANGLYGFQEPNTFQSVAELIKYYKTNKLSEYNDQLNITLRFPVSKTKSEMFGHSNDCFELSDEDLIDLLHKTMKEYMELNGKVEKNSCENENCQKQLDDVTKTIKGVDRVQTWCNNHIEHIMNGIHTNPKMKEHSLKSLQILNTKLNHCAEVMKSCNGIRESLTVKSTALINSMAVDRPNLKKLNRRQQQCIRQLKERGVPNDMFDADNIKLEELCEQIRNTLNINNPINDRSTWFIETFTRADATSLLSGKRHGTFLVRKSREANSYALDIVVNNIVQHCLIYCCEGMYGFVRNECLYKSLSDLVRTFHMRSLEQYNSELKAKLTYPVNYTSTTL